MWVSTAMVGSPKAVLSTTLAVLRPTPGRASSAPRSRGTSPPCRSTRIRQVAITFLALVLNRPMVEMWRLSASSPRSRIACGVLATGYRRRVALLTPTSVACADSRTAISSSNGVEYSSSVVGFGLSSDRRSNICVISARVSCLPRLRRGAAAFALKSRCPGRAGARAPARPRRPAAATVGARLPRPGWRRSGGRAALPRSGPAGHCGPGGARAPPRPAAAPRAPPAAARARRPEATRRQPGRSRPGRRRSPRPRRRGQAAPVASPPARRRSPAAELRPALVQERAGALAHVVGGEDQAELSGLELQALVDAGLAADVDAVQDAAQGQRRGGGQLPGQLHRGLLQLRRRQDLVDDAELERAGGVDRRPGQAQLQGGGASGQPQQALGAAETRDQAEVDFRLAQLRGVGGQAQVAGHGQLQPAA